MKVTSAKRVALNRVRTEALKQEIAKKTAQEVMEAIREERDFENKCKGLEHYREYPGPG